MAHLHHQLRHFLSALIAACGLLAALPAAAGQWDFGLYASLWGSHTGRSPHCPAAAGGAAASRRRQ